MKSLSCVQLFATPWTVAYQAPPSMGFSKQECWSGLPFPSPGDLPNPGIEPRSPALQADSLPAEPPGKPSKQQTRRKYNPISSQDYHLIQPCPSEGKKKLTSSHQRDKSHPTRSLHKPLDQTYEGRNQKKVCNLEDWKKETSNTIS